MKYLSKDMSKDEVDALSDVSICRPKITVDQLRMHWSDCFGGN